MKPHKRSRGINIIGWVVISSNLIFLGMYYSFLLKGQPISFPSFTSFIAMVAVFPLDFFYTHLKEFWLVHLLWVLIVVMSAFGVLLLNKFARKVFIVLNIIHVVILGYIVCMQFGRITAFLDYFFRLYFNLVAAGTYVGFITIPEVREQFKASLESMKFSLWFKEYNLKQSAERDADGYYKLGLAYGRLGRFSDAISNLKKAIAINPENENFHFKLGMFYFQQKKYFEAIDELKETIHRNPIHWDATYHLGMAYENEGCMKEAIEAFKRAEHIDPENALVYQSLGKAYIGSGSFSEAISAFKKAVDLDPEDSISYWRMGVVYCEQFGKFNEAREVLQVAISLNPGMTEAHFQLGIVSIKLERYKDAIRCFKEVIRDDESNKQAHYQLGFAYAMIKDFDSARRECRFLKDADSDLANNLTMLLK